MSRLIDADEMKKDIQRQVELAKMLYSETELMSYITEVLYDGFIKEIDKTPTVVEINGDITKVVVRGVEYVPVVRCRDCECGEQDEIGRWYCRSFGCQVGDSDGSGYCVDGERRE